MKALKYGLALMIGLSMLGLSARVQAQTSDPMAEANADAQQTVQNDEPQRGELQIPKYIEDLVAHQEFEQAAGEFEKFIKAAKGDACDMNYVPYSFYARLVAEDTATISVYKEKADTYAKKFLQACGNTVEAYMLRDRMMEPKNYDSTVVWMTKAIALDAEYAFLYVTRGYALWELKRTQEACADYKKAKELNEFYGDYYDDNCAKSK